MADRKILFVDVETSGVDERVNGIIQISGMITINNKVVEIFNKFPRLFPKDVFDPESTKAHGLTEEQARSELRPNPYNIYLEVSGIFNGIVKKYDKYDKMFFVAYNAVFDDRFLREFWRKNNDKFYGSYFWRSPIDIASIASMHLAEQRATLPNFKQHTVAKALGIEVDDSRLHDSMYDIELTKAIYDTLSNFKTT